MPSKQHARPLHSFIDGACALAYYCYSPVVKPTIFPATPTVRCGHILTVVVNSLKPPVSHFSVIFPPFSLMRPESSDYYMSFPRRETVEFHFSMKTSIVDMSRVCPKKLFFYDSNDKVHYFHVFKVVLK